MPLFAGQQDFSAFQLKNLGDPINDLIKIIVENLCPFNTAQIMRCSAPGTTIPAFLGITTANVAEGITRKVKKNARPQAPNEARKQLIQPRATTPTVLAKKHISEIERMTDASTLLPELVFDLNKLKSIPQETRDHLRQIVTNLLAQIPNMTIVYNSLIDNLNQIKMELRER